MNSAFNQLLVWLLPFMPKPLIKMVAQQYVAGETIPEMLSTVRRIRQEGCLCTVDLLGEFITDISQARTTAEKYKHIIETLSKNFPNELPASFSDTSVHDSANTVGISIKLTALGLLLDQEVCYQLIHEIVGHARDHEMFVRIDMEDSGCTSDTLDMYSRLRREYNNVGIVLQAYLRRTLGDTRHIMKLRAGDFRLCKGIYNEPREIAYKDPSIINKNYTLILEEMFKKSSYVGIATHDEKLVWEAFRLIDQYQLAPHEYEFQMLLGVDTQMRKMIASGGHRLRVYVPFGDQWHAYSLRRLKENPKIAGYVFQNFWKRVFKVQKRDSILEALQPLNSH